MEKHSDIFIEALRHMRSGGVARIDGEPGYYMIVERLSSDPDVASLGNLAKFDDSGDVVPCKVSDDFFNSPVIFPDDHYTRLEKTGFINPDMRESIGYKFAHAKKYTLL